MPEPCCATCTYRQIRQRWIEWYCTHESHEDWRWCGQVVQLGHWPRPEWCPLKADSE